VVEGSEGTAVLTPDGCLRLYRTDGNEEWQFPKDTVAQSFTSTQQHFIDCLQSGRSFETSGVETLKTMALVFGAYQSAREGRFIELAP
jgi:predicted dehydrogenase